MTIDGIRYEVVREREVNGFPNRFELTLKRPKGKRCYWVVRYENGTLSSVVGA